MKKIFLLITLTMLSFNAGAQQVEPSPADIATYKRDLSNIEHYLNKIETLAASFTQIDSESNVSQGMFYLSRPGKLRWEYYPPSPVLIVAKGSILAYYDSELDQVSHIGLDDSLSGFLTRKNINFEDPSIEIISYSKDDKKIEITIAQKEKAEEGQLTMVFNSSNYELSSMKITDAIGKQTKISFDTMVYGKPLSSDLFKLPKVKN